MSDRPTSQWYRRMVRWAIFAWGLVMAGSGHAQSADFDPANPQWNGLSSLVSILEASGPLELDAPTAVPVHQILWLVQPTSVDTDALYTWVSGGGMLVLADEAGGADTFIESLGLRVELDPGEHAEVFQADARLPVMTPNGVHALSRDTERVVGNGVRPLRGMGRAVFELDEGGGLVWDVSLGRGRIVVLADPSMLINLMLPIESNADLVTSVVRYMCPRGPCTQRLAVGTVPELEVGEFSGQLSPSWRMLSEWVDVLKDVELDQRFIWFANVLLAAGVIFVFWTAFPSFVPSVPPSMPSHWPLAIRSTLFNEISRYSGVLGETSFVRPAGHLAQSFIPLFNRGATRWGLPPLQSEGGTNQARAVAGAWTQRMEGNLRGFALSRRIRELTWLFATLTRIPKGPTLPAQTQVLTREEFMKLYDLSREILEKLEMHGEFDPSRPPR